MASSVPGDADSLTLLCLKVTTCLLFGSAPRPVLPQGTSARILGLGHIYLGYIYNFLYDRRKGRKQHFCLFHLSAFSKLMLHKELTGGVSSRVAHQAWGAGEGPAHTHALLLVDAEGVGLDGQLVFQPALGHYQQLQCVLCLPQPQLEGLQRVIDGEHLVHEPGVRAEKAQFTQVHLLSASNCARCWDTAVSQTREAQSTGKTGVEEAGK